MRVSATASTPVAAPQGPLLAEWNASPSIQVKDRSTGTGEGLPPLQ